MSGNPWSRFFWQDWDSEPCLRACSLAAQGLWMRMLCIAARANQIGYVTINGQPVDSPMLARLCGCAEHEAVSLIGELERNGVFSRDRTGRIYNRRMVADAKRARQNRVNGQQGGNPSLLKDKGKLASDNQPDNLEDKPQEPITSKPDKEEPSVSKPNGFETRATPVRKRHEYPQDFLVFWAGYPTDKNMAKLQAWQVWRRMSDEDRKLAVASLPAFRSYCSSNPDYRTVHANRYLSYRRYEGHLEAAKAIEQRAKIKPGTPEWKAWREFKITSGERTSFMDSLECDGREYEVPSRWPPGVQEDAA